MADAKRDPGLTELLGLLTEKDDATTRLDEEKKKALEERRALHARMKEHVLAGETTGDPIADYVISVHGYPSDELTKAYRDLKTRVDACIGQPVLVIEARTERNVRYCFGEPPGGGDRSTHLEQTYYFGILTSPLALTVGDGDLAMPTERHLRRYDRGSDRIFREEGGIRALMMRYFMVEADKTVRATDSFSLPVPALRFVIGWEELDAFGDSADSPIEECNISLRDRGSEKYANIRLRRSDCLLSLFKALDIAVPEEMSRLLAYAGRNGSEAAERAMSALEKRDALLAKFAKAHLKGRNLDNAREEMKKLNGILKRCHHIFSETGTKGSVPDRVAAIVAELEGTSKTAT